MQGYKFFLTILLILIINYSTAQQRTVNKYGLFVLHNRNELLTSIKRDSLQSMAELKRLIPHLAYELRYATSNNFTGRRMYPRNTNSAFLRLPVALALQKVQDELNQKGYGLKIWDAYRPYSATISFWELVHDERYVANPHKGSGHNRGTAVDLTLIQLPDGKELNLGTDFDNFSDTAHHNFVNLPADALRNRELLRTTMEKYGFQSLATEWWHYSWPKSAAFDCMDLSFKTLGKISYQPN